MILADADKRISAADALKHPWFKVDGPIVNLFR
jgi:hypothetical protein